MSFDPSALGPAAGGAGDPYGSGAPAGGGAPSPEEILKSILDLALLYRTVETDPADKLKIEKASTLVQQILADRQSQHDQLIGGNAAAIRRFAGG